MAASLMEQVDDHRSLTSQNETRKFLPWKTYKVMTKRLYGNVRFGRNKHTVMLNQRTKTRNFFLNILKKV